MFILNKNCIVKIFPIEYKVHGIRILLINYISKCYIKSIRLIWNFSNSSIGNIEKSIKLHVLRNLLTNYKLRSVCKMRKKFLWKFQMRLQFSNQFFRITYTCKLRFQNKQLLRHRQHIILKNLSNKIICIQYINHFPITHDLLEIFIDWNGRLFLLFW